MEESNKLYNYQKEYEKVTKVQETKMLKSFNLQNLLIKPFTTLRLQIIILKGAKHGNTINCLVFTLIYSGQEIWYQCGHMKQPRSHHCIAILGTTSRLHSSRGGSTCSN